MNQNKNRLYPAISLIMVIVLTGFAGENGQGIPVNCLNLMPVPESVELKTGRFTITPDFKVFGDRSTGKRVRFAVSRMLAGLSRHTGLRFSRYQISTKNGSDATLMSVSCRRPGKLAIHENESYHLLIQPSQITLSAETDIGILRGTETLLQLLQAGRSGYYLPCLEIRDAPRFTWRGLLIDSCRHFIPLDVIKRNLDAMCAVKLNVLHWHLSEDQGFRVESKTFPRLHGLGSDGLFYSQEQIRDIIRYAANRGIRVVPEFDIPGHATSWFVGYPELASAPGPYKIERRFGIFDPCFNPIKEETYRFFDRFFSEMAALFPDEYLHIGGDEVNGNHWDDNPEIQEFMKKNNIPDNHSLQAHFNRRISGILRKYGKKMVGWEQILQPGLPRDTVVQSYLGDRSMVEAARMGYRVLNTKADEMYIDLLYPTDFHYLFDPLPGDTPLNEEQRKRVLGSEATMWGELVSPETIDSRIWPRTAAIAERLWSPARIRDVEDMVRRLAFISIQLEEHGLTHIKNQPVMLRRLCRGADIGPLKILVDTLTPIILYDRPDWRERYTQLTPLTRLVDAAIPDPPASRRFRKMVHRFLENPDPTLLIKIKKQLLTWKNNHRKLRPIIDQSPVLREIEALSENLSRIAALGLECLEQIDRRKNADKIWIERQMAFLKLCKEPQADMKLLVVTPVEKLLEKLNQ